MATEQHAQAAPQFRQIARIARTFLDAGECTRDPLTAGFKVDYSGNSFSGYNTAFAAEFIRGALVG